MECDHIFCFCRSRNNKYQPLLPLAGCSHGDRPALGSYVATKCALSCSCEGVFSHFRAHFNCIACSLCHWEGWASVLLATCLGDFRFFPEELVPP